MSDVEMVEGQGYSDSDESTGYDHVQPASYSGIGIPAHTHNHIQTQGATPSNSAFFSPSSSTRQTGMGAYNEPSSVSSSYKSGVASTAFAGSFSAHSFNTNTNSTNTNTNTNAGSFTNSFAPASSSSSANPAPSVSGAGASVQTGFFPSSLTSSIQQQRTSSYQSFVQPPTVQGSRLTSFATQTFEPDHSPEGQAHSPNIDAPAHWRSSSFGEAVEFQPSVRTSNLTSKLAGSASGSAAASKSNSASGSVDSTVAPSSSFGGFSDYGSSDTAAASYSGYTTAPSSRRDSTGEKSLFARRKPSSGRMQTVDDVKGKGVEDDGEGEGDEDNHDDKKVKVGVEEGKEVDKEVVEVVEVVESAGEPAGDKNAAAAASAAAAADSTSGPEHVMDSIGNVSVPVSETEDDVHLDIANYPVNDLLLMLTALLQKIIEANDSLHPHHYHHASQNYVSNKFTANVLAFHGRNIPAISLHSYLLRILKYCPTTNEVFLSLLVYFDRIAKRANAGEFTGAHAAAQNDGTSSTASSLLAKQVPPPSDIPATQLFVMDSYNIHRLIIAGITVSSKFFSDVFYKNSRYAKVGGLPVEELNHLELQFLLLTDFHLMIPLEVLQRYGNLLLRFWKREGEAANEQANSSS
ncbi:PHO85 cyclin-6 [Yarrowia sp. C11]|nr:PHO85 cyclin-6 [Yarrowia sp. E02]KAG5373212.1 PHO85 cyclin-6 [Yarrowia sp. C11]